MRFSSKIGVNTAGLTSFAKVFGIIAIVLPGLYHVFIKGHSENLEDFIGGSSTDPGDYVMAFYGVYFTFSGAFFLVNVIEEVKPPVKRNLIGAVLLSTIMISALYLLGNC